MKKLDGALAKFLFEDEPWKERAACRTNDAANMLLFFPSRGRSQVPGKTICASCPVKEECGEYGRRTGSVGMWGGKMKKPVPLDVDESEIKPCQEM